MTVVRAARRTVAVVLVLVVAVAGLLYRRQLGSYLDEATIPSP